MAKRGVELSMNVIIIAAIALIVLVVLVILVTRGALNVQSGTGCTSAGGACQAVGEGETCQSQYNLQSLGQKDCKIGELCCYTPPSGGGQP
jgi:hypothetical protein